MREDEYDSNSAILDLDKIICNIAGDRIKALLNDYDIDITDKDDIYFDIEDDVAVKVYDYLMGIIDHELDSVISDRGYDKK